MWDGGREGVRKGVWDGATVLLTGASSGIGMELARALAREKGIAALLLTARREAVLTKLKQELQEVNPDLAVDVFPCDLGAADGPRTVYKNVSVSHTPTVLIPNAGVGFAGGFLDGDLDTYERIIHLNNRAMVALTHLFLPGILSAGPRGGLLFIASTSAFAGCPNFLVYSASKAFVRAFAEGLSEECRCAGTAVAVVTPGGCRDTAFDSEAGCTVTSLALTVGPVRVPYPTEHPRRIAKHAVRSLTKVRYWWYLWPSTTYFTDTLQQVITAPASLLFPRFLLSRLQGAVMKNSIPPAKRMKIKNLAHDAKRRRGRKQATERTPLHRVPKS